MNPRVKAVKARDNYKLEIILSSGEVGIYDCSPLLNFGVFTFIFILQKRWLNNEKAQKI